MRAGLKRQRPQQRGGTIAESRNPCLIDVLCPTTPKKMNTEMDMNIFFLYIKVGLYAIFFAGTLHIYTCYLRRKRN
jgi:hypothetical protein